jgi:long-subunit acyl-CoA synthetase (AMP-forming)
MNRTVLDVFEACASKHQASPALRVKRNGQWNTLSWKNYRDEVRLAARALIKLGVKPKEGVSIIGYNRPEWLVANLAAIYAGGIPAGIYTTSSPDQCQYVSDHCDASVVFVENAEQLEKYKVVREQLPKVKAIVMMEGHDPTPNVYSWRHFLQLGEQVAVSDLEARMQAQQSSDVCTLIYTSGTTGTPKGVMITHRNMTWVAQTVMSMIGGVQSDRFISYLPLSHIAEQAVSVHGPMTTGACVYFAESMEALADNLREVRPTVFLGVPRVWEKIQAKMQRAGEGAPAWRKKLIAWAKEQGLEGVHALEKGQAPGLGYKIADKLVFSKVRERLGLDQCRFRATAAAPISRDTLDFFASLGLPIYEVYGMSECTGPATISLPNHFEIGKAGFVLPGTEMKIAEDGEICMRGPHVFAGYFKDEKATREAIDSEGWLHSGDVGTLDGRNYLQITDRKKELLITAGGENVAPQLIEGFLRGIPLVSQAVVVGDRKKYLAALLTLDPEKLMAIAEQVGSSAKDPEAAAKCQHIWSYLNGQIDNVNQRLARVQAVKKFKIITTDFSVDGGELTPTLKLKRRVINEKYAGDIEGMYN